MAKQVAYHLIGKDVSASKTFDQVGKSADKAEKKTSHFGAKLAGALSGVALVAFGKKAIDAFSAVEDATGAAGVQFGKTLPQVLAFADKATASYGLSKRAAIEAQNTFGTLGKAAGLQGKDLADFAGRLTGLAGDMASFKGTSTEQAIEAVGAALRGESEPIRAYGVLLDDATLRNEALRMGLIKNTKTALTPQQKALAAQAAILKQTKDAQGDFARTSDSTANKQKQFQAKLENLQATLGQKLAPVLLKGIDLLTSFGRWTQNNKDWLVPLVTVIGTAAIAVWAVNAAAKAYTATQMALNIVMSANPIGLIIIAIAALVAGFVIAYKKCETFRNIVNGVFSWIKSHWPLLLGILTGPIGLAVVMIIKHWDSVVSFAKSIPGKIGGALSSVYDAVLTPFRLGFNAIAALWNHTVGRLSFKVPGWVPGIGGKGWSVPDIPYWDPGPSPDSRYKGPQEKAGGGPGHARGMALGGIVKHRPGGIYANIGEGSYDEAVIPLPRGARGLGVTVHVTVSNAVIGTAQQVARALAKEINEALADLGDNGHSMAWQHG